MILPRLVVGATLAALALSGCGSASASPAATATPTPGRLSGSLTVFGASSLTAAFNGAEIALESANPGFRAQYSYAGSQALVTQIVNGAPADVIATANTTTMQQLVSAGLVETAAALCKNELEIAVAPGNPQSIMSLADLARPDVSVVLAATSVPVGTYASQALNKAGFKLIPKSLQLDDAEVVEQVESGNADAGIVFVTDIVTAAGKVQGVIIPAAQNVIGTYEIAALKGGHNLPAAEAFVMQAVSGSIQAELRTAGFMAP